MLYRCYFLDKYGRISGPPAEIECPDDESAVETAQELLDGRAIEVWDRARLIARLEAQTCGDPLD